MRHRRDEVYVRIIDVGDLRALIRDQSSIRATARAAGWKSHTALCQILSGERSPTMTPGRALAVARHLGVRIEDLFVVRSSNDHGRSVRRDDTEDAA